MSANSRALKLLILIIMSSMLIYVGHFLLGGKEQGLTCVNKFPVKDNLPAVQYKHLSMDINGNKQEINILEVNLESGKAKIKPVLSFNSIFGFEKLSEMAIRSKAFAAINAGFFYQYGQPSGMVVIDGKLLSGSTGKYPVFIVDGGKAELKEIKTRQWLLIGSSRIEVDSINKEGKNGSAVIYTPEYGKSNRVEEKNLTLTIRNNRVAKIARYNGEANIPYDGMLLTIYEPYEDKLHTLDMQEGSSVEFQVSPRMSGSAQAYECGSWIIRDGRIVIGEKDAWVGVLTNREPRTAVGIMKDGTAVMVTVDGRQPGHSIGLTARELGEFLLQYGVQNAAMLDGGASTEMIVKGKIVNRPSNKGKERPIAGGIIVVVNNKNDGLW